MARRVGLLAGLFLVFQISLTLLNCPVNGEGGAEVVIVTPPQMDDSNSSGSGGGGGAPVNSTQTRIQLSIPTTTTADPSPEGRACPICTDESCGNPVYKWIIDFHAITKVFVALVFGTAVFFGLFFAYKLVSYIDDEVPAQTSTYYGSSGTPLKPLFLRRSSDWNPSLALITQKVVEALERRF